MGVRRWIHCDNVHNFFCPFGGEKNFEDGKIISPCQGEYCMAWGWYSDFFPDIELDDDDPKICWGTCTIVPPAGDSE